MNSETEEWKSASLKSLTFRPRPVESSKSRTDNWSSTLASSATTRRLFDPKTLRWGIAVKNTRSCINRKTRNNRFLSSSSSGRTSEGEIKKKNVFVVIDVVAIDELKYCGRSGTRIGFYVTGVVLLVLLLCCCCCVIIIFLLLLLLSLLMILQILSHLHKPLRQQC